MSVQQTKATGKAEKFQLKLVRMCVCDCQGVLLYVCLCVWIVFFHQPQELWPTLPLRATCILNLSPALDCPPFLSLCSFLQCQFNPCFPGVKCVNTAPGYRCEACPLGFTGTPVEGVGVQFAQTNKQVIHMEVGGRRDAFTVVETSLFGLC